MPPRDPLAESHGDEEFETNLEGAGGGPMEGQFIVRCDDVKSDVAKSSGNDMWVWSFGVISDLKGNDAHSGRSLPLYTALSEAALWKVEETLCALGLAEPGSQAKFKRSQAIGRLAIAAVSMDDSFDGRARPKIDALAPHPRGAGYRGESGRPTNPTPSTGTRPAAPAPAQRPAPPARPTGPPTARPPQQQRPAPPPARKPPVQPADLALDQPGDDPWGGEEQPTDEEVPF